MCVFNLLSHVNTLFANTDLGTSDWLWSGEVGTEKFQNASAGSRTEQPREL